MKGIIICLSAIFAIAAFAFTAKATDMPWELRNGGRLYVTGVVDCVELEIPGEVRIITENAFAGCETIERVYLPQSLERVDVHAFDYCINLKEVEFRGSESELYKAAFFGCRSLSSVKLPDKLKEIRTETFMGCSSLKEIVLPVSITNIDSYAFANCTSLCRVYVRSDSSFTMDDTAFRGCPSCLEFIEFDCSTNELAFVEVSLDPNGGALEETTIRTVFGCNFGLLPTPERDGFEFDGWWTDAEGGSTVISTTKVVGDNYRTLFAHWRKLEFGEFTTGGDAEWLHLSNGEWQSGMIGAGKTSWLQKLVDGKGSLSFEWMVSNHHDVFYTLDLYVDGEKCASAAGSTKWVSVSYDLDSPGIHYFKWAFSMVGTLEPDPNYGRVRNIIWTPSVELPEIGEDATSNEVAAAVEEVGFTDENVAKLIGGDAAKYGKFRAWASGVEGGESAAATSHWAAASYLLGAKQLFGSQPCIKISDCSVAGTGTESGFSVTMQFLDGEEPREVSADSVAELFEVSENLRDWEGYGNFSVQPVSEGMKSSHTFTLTPSDSAAKLFLRLRASSGQ